MEIRRSKNEQLEILETLSAPTRQPLEARQRRFEEKQQRLDEEQRQLERDWQRFNEEYETRRKILDELWREDDGGEPEPRLEEAQDAPVPQQEHSPSPNGTNKLSVSEKALLIVDESPDDSIITQSEVTREYLEKYPDNVPRSLVSLISHALSQWATEEDGLLELVEKGAGSRAAKYRKRVRTVNVGP